MTRKSSKKHDMGHKSDWATFTLQRSGVLTPKVKGNRGEWGRLTVKGVDGTVLEFDTLERRSGYVSLKAGNYYVVTHYSSKVGGSKLYPKAKDKYDEKVNSLMVANHAQTKTVRKDGKSKSHWLEFLIHAATRVTSVEGCVAPGTKDDPTHLRDSTDAMRKIFAAMGEFHRANLKVLNGPTY